MQSPQFAAHADMEERHWWFLGRRHILATLLHELVRLSKEKVIIDVGCGTGGLTHFLSKDYTVIGVEPTAEGYEAACTRFPRCVFIHGYAPEDVPQFKNADAILLIEVLEHIEHDRDFVHRLIGAMKPGAILMMLAPADMSLWSPHDDAFEHFRRYDGIEDFRALWTGMPVKERLVTHCMRRLYPVVKMMRKLSKFRGKAWGKGGTDITVPNPLINGLLKRIYCGEAEVLLKTLRGESKGYEKGVSVLTILEKK